MIFTKELDLSSKEKLTDKIDELERYIKYMEERLEFNNAVISRRFGKIENSAAAQEEGGNNGN